jgi:hypothetical protein
LVEHRIDRVEELDAEATTRSSYQRPAARYSASASSRAARRIGRRRAWVSGSMPLSSCPSRLTTAFLLKSVLRLGTGVCGRALHFAFLLRRNAVGTGGARNIADRFVRRHMREASHKRLECHDGPRGELLHHIRPPIRVRVERVSWPVRRNCVPVSRNGVSGSVSSSVTNGDVGLS